MFDGELFCDDCDESDADCKCGSWGICDGCNGSGQGMYEGAPPCQECGGLGETSR